MFSSAPYYYKDRILCMAQFLFNVEQQNRLEQRGLLKRFSSKCYGKQDTLESIRALKADKFKELKDKRESREFKEWFFKYKGTHVKGTYGSLKIPPSTENSKKTFRKNKRKTIKTKELTEFQKLWL
jgi:hypothetical protein